jgi:hypothetical protein
LSKIKTSGAVSFSGIIQQQFRLLQASLSLRPFADRFGLLAALAPFRIRQPSAS